MNSTNETLGWVAEPDGRGTVGILWTCFATIFLSTWSVTHPNVPALKDSQFKIFYRKMGYMLLGVLAPEILAYLSLDSLKKSRRFRKNLQFTHPRSTQAWSLQQYFFLGMGGYVINTSPTSGSQASPDPPSSTSLLLVDPEDLISLIKNKVVEFPTLDDKDIDDRSKANWFTKSLSLCQILYFILQLLGRAIEDLPTTTLELFTLSIVACAIVTYIAWWSKPFDVQRPVVLQSQVQEYQWPRSITRVVLTTDQSSDAAAAFMFVPVTVLFAAVHLIGWNFHFPSRVESWLWRSGSISCGTLPLCIFLLATVTLENSSSKFIAYLLTGLYVFARLALVVEVLVGLRSVPVGVYQSVKWSQYFPSFG